MKNQLFRWLKIYEDEARLFIWSAFLLFFINVSQSLLNNYAETAFLKRFGVEYLPILSLIHISEPTRQVLVSRMPSSA